MKPKSNGLPRSVAAIFVLLAAAVGVAQTKTGNSTPQATSAESKEDLPLGISLPGWGTGFIASPFAARHQIVDVTGLPAGMVVKCPYTGRMFKLPAQAPVVAPEAAVTPPPSENPGVSKASEDSANRHDAASRRRSSLPEESRPFATPLPDRPGLVRSPYAAAHQLVDVVGLPAGMEVKCPYSGRLFRVPALPRVGGEGDSRPIPMAIRLSPDCLQK